jgi:S-adenosylmethionine:tRNA ribosyltransferase-isomerase
MRLSDLDYELPRELIAQEPVFPRDHSRMMVVPLRDKGIHHHHFFDLPRFLTRNDVLVFNRSKVIPSRIRFVHRGKKCEFFFLKLSASGLWEVLVHPGRFFHKHDNGYIASDVSFEIIDVNSQEQHGSRLVRVHDPYNRPLFELLAAIGQVPLPPYIAEQKSVEHYQTVYARDPGSVAAPTAGFHFTEPLLHSLGEKGIQMEFVTLHVGAGTFLPVTSDDVTSHVMHSEYYEIGKDVAERLAAAKKSGKRIIAVGTTSCRTLESAFLSDPPKLSGETKLFIYPGYRFVFVDGLITNFHLPRSTLLMLVSALASRERVLSAYMEAISCRYRFFSFGDGMLLI